MVVEQILAFASSPNMVTNVKNLSPIFKQIASRCFTSLNIVIWIVRSVLSINSKKFPQNLYIVDIICHFLQINQAIFFRHFWQVIGKIVMMFSNNVSFMVKILTFYLIMIRTFTLSLKKVY